MRKTPTPRECPSCKRLHTGRCQCGYERPKQASLLTEGGGELAALVAGRKFEQHCRKKPKPADKAVWYAQALGYVRQRGKQDGYAAHLFFGKFKEWPARTRGVVPLPPQPDVLAYIKSRNIGRAKSRQVA